MRSELGDKERLGHILDATALIEKALLNKSREIFMEDYILQAAIQRWIQIIGEAASKISKIFRDMHSEVNWKAISGLRNIIVHEYFGIDLERIWEVAQSDVPELRIKLENLYNKA